MNLNQSQSAKLSRKNYNFNANYVSNSGSSGVIEHCGPNSHSNTNNPPLNAMNINNDSGVNAMTTNGAINPGAPTAPPQNHS